LGQPLRVALLGAMQGPGLDEVMNIIGLDEVKRRVEAVKNYLQR
jgi:glutamyl/glutaminyl-tRNA synthetase